MDWQLGVALSVSLGALALVWRGVDVRLVLVGAGVVLTSLAGKPHFLLDVFLRVMGDGSIVGPICSAMGYAFVLRAVGADRAMVELMTAPLGRLRWLLVPGGCVVGFVTNMAITSQTAAAAAVGPILVPLLLQAGYTPALSGAVLLLGCSAGGNLFNPGEPDIITIATATGSSAHQAIAAVSVPHVVGVSAAIAMLSFVVARRNRNAPTAEVESPHVSLATIFRALLAPLPIVLLLLFLPQWRLVPPLMELYPNGLPVTHVMVPCAIIAIAFHWRRASELAVKFFEGLGYGFANVISIIIAAACFLEGLRVMGVVEHLVALLQGSTLLAPLLSLFVPLGLAVLSGSGTAPSVTFSRAVLPSMAEAAGVQHAIELGALGAIGASLGRTMSPLAAVVVFSAQLVGVQPRVLVRLTAVPLLVGSCAAVVMYYLMR